MRDISLSESTKALVFNQRHFNCETLAKSDYTSKLREKNAMQSELVLVIIALADTICSMHNSLPKQVR